MHDQPRYEPFESSSLFADGRAARPIPQGTVARGQLDADPAYYQGKSATGEPLEVFPVEITRDLLERGRERYDIYCSPCHDRTGSGTGMIVRRGYPQPTSFHIDRLREAPPGYFFNAISSGFGVMPGYAVQVPVADRWAIVAYVRALQASQYTSIDDVDPVKRRLLEADTGGVDE